MEKVTVEEYGHFALTYKYPIGLGVSDANTYVLIWHYTNFCRGYLVNSAKNTIDIMLKGTTLNVSYFYNPSLQ